MEEKKRQGPQVVDFSFSADAPLTKEELALSYSKYYYVPFTPMNPLVSQILAAPVDPATCLTVQDAEKLFLPGYLENELGYCIFPDGTGYAASYVFMPGVTIDMIEWYMNWQFIQPPSVPKEAGNIRYKIWCPGKHWDTGGSDEDSNQRHAGRGKYAGMSLAERSHYANDYMVHKSPIDDNEATINSASSINPIKEFRVSPEIAKYAAEGYCCGASHSGLFSNIHYYRYNKLLGGVELRSRYWYGWGLNENGVIVSNQANMPPQNIEEIKGCCIHNIEEYTHLASFLPQLYAEEGWKPIDVY